VHNRGKVIRGGSSHDGVKGRSPDHGSGSGGMARGMGSRGRKKTWFL
jgi:hypothetical protein